MNNTFCGYRHIIIRKINVTVLKSQFLFKDDLDSFAILVQKWHILANCFNIYPA